MKRIQRKRIKGWKMPDNTISVTRPSDYGNPFKIGHHYIKGGGGIPRLGLQFIYTEAYDGYQDETYTTIKTIEESLEWYKWYVSTWSVGEIDKIKKELKGKDLACWCPLDKPCHADILIKLVNDVL